MTPKGKKQEKEPPLLAIKDITGRKRIKGEKVKRLRDIEGDLRASEKIYKSVIGSAQDAIMSMDNNGDILSWNTAASRMFGYTEKEALGKSLHVLLSPKRYLDAYRKGFSRFKRTGKGAAVGKTLELAAIRKDGTEFPMELSMSTLLLNGKWCATGIVRDISARKEAEEKKRESEEKFRKIFDSAGDGILLADPEKKTFLMGNDTICRMLGYSKKELIKLGVMDIHPEKDVPYVIEQFQRQARGDFRITKDLPVLRKDGSVFYADVDATTVKIAGKKYLTGFFHDNTERKKIEEEKRRSAELKIAGEIKSKFISTISHELRSPMVAIREGVNLVLEGMFGNINDKQKELLLIAKNDTDRLARLINNVLDFQKMETGKMEFDARENDINETALESIRTMELLAEEKGLKLTKKLDDGLPKLRFDKDKIIQVFVNLLSNAIKFTEKGTITISTKKESGVIHVTVKDTGPGVKKEDLERLFLPFELMDPRRDKAKGGTGLGLAICRDIINEHNGKIWAKSKLGKETTIHFTLPIK